MAKVSKPAKALKPEKESKAKEIEKPKSYYNPAYYQKNKADFTKKTRELRAKYKAQKADNVKKGKDIDEGIPYCYTSAYQKNVQKKYHDKRKKKQQEQVSTRQYKTDWKRKQREIENQAKIDAYNKEFGYE